MGDPVLVGKMAAGHSQVKSRIKSSLLLIAFALGCMALANPRKADPGSGEARKGIDIVVALDVSNSMKAKDILPDRMSRARQFMSRLIDNVQEDRLAFIVFAGSAYVQMPLTFDRDAARMYTSTADPGLIKAQGTSMGDVFEKAKLLFSDESNRFRTIILITDGETHDENALEGAREMAKMGVMVNTVGIGSTEGSTIMDSAGNPKRDQAGAVVISKLNEDILKEIARATNGTYIHLESADEAVKQVMAQYAQIDKKALGDTSQFTYHTWYAWLVIPMFLILLAEIFIPDRKKISA